MKRTLETPVPIGWGIRNIRKARGMTLTKLADKVGISKSHLSQIELGKIPNPTWVIIKKSAEFLGTKVETLQFESFYVLKKIGKRVQELRKENNLTQADLAKRTGLTDEDVTQIEDGHGASLDQIEQIAKTFNKPISELKPTIGSEAVSWPQYTPTKSVKDDVESLIVSLESPGFRTDKQEELSVSERELINEVIENPAVKLTAEIIEMTPSEYREKMEKEIISFLDYMSYKLRNQIEFRNHEHE